MVMRSRKRRQDRFGSAKSPGLVGTEAAAASAMKENAKNFSYPQAGFITPIEHSLLYNVLSSPQVYPVEAVKDLIAAEDFNEYLETKEVAKVGSRKLTSGDNRGDDDPQYVCSYAQLSALLTLSAENWPPPDNSTSESGQDDRDKKTDEESYTDDGDDDRPYYGASSTTASPNDTMSVPQVLCKALLQTVVRYADENDLDREHEVQELLAPLENHHQRKGKKTFLTLVLPTYLGYAASIATANPLPVLLGTMATQVLSVKVAAKEHREASNLQDLQTVTNRTADPETTSLLDESH